MVNNKLVCEKNFNSNRRNLNRCAISEYSFYLLREPLLKILLQWCAQNAGQKMSKYQRKSS